MSDSVTLWTVAQPDLSVHGIFLILKRVKILRTPLPFLLE